MFANSAFTVRGLRDLDDVGVGRLEEGLAGHLLDGGGAPRPPGETDVDLYDVVGRALFARARRSPLVVLLDDIKLKSQPLLKNG